MEFHFTEFHLQNLLDKSIEINEVDAQSNQVLLQKPVNVPEGIIYGDGDRILQVITNFISNAMKNSPISSEIALVTSRHDHFVRIGIKDHGPGIAKEFHSLIFQKFAQISSNKHEKEGTGLGLSICKAIIEKHGGKIGFDTSPEGSTFWFELSIKSI